MSTLELKNIISQYLEKADDRVLRIVKAVFETYEKEAETSSEVDFFDELPKEIKELLMESREQAKQGKVKSHKEVMAHYRSKYNIAG